MRNSQKGINAYNFLQEVKQIFPNATMESIKLSKTLMSLGFCWCYGEVGLKNYPDKYHAQINKINAMAKQISLTKKRYTEFLLYSL
jgi:hypothetical protein